MLYLQQKSMDDFQSFINGPKKFNVKMTNKSKVHMVYMEQGLYGSKQPLSLKKVLSTAGGLKMRTWNWIVP